MVPSVNEIILLIVIVLCIFGLGKLGDISERFAELRAKRKRGLPPEDAIDITPEQERRAAGGASAPKPGTREQPVDEADIDDSDRNSKA